MCRLLKKDKTCRHARARPRETGDWRARTTGARRAARQERARGRDVEKAGQGVKGIDWNRLSVTLDIINARAKRAR